MQRLTSNWIIEETTREKPISPKFNLPFEKNGNKKFFDPPENVCSQKNGVIDGSWQEFLAQIFPLHCRLIPESFMLMCSKEKKCAQKNRSTFGQKQAKIGRYPLTALVDVLEGRFFTISSILKLHGGLPKKIIKIRPTVAELSVKNHFPIVNANP